MNEIITDLINTLLSVKCEVSEAPKIIGVINELAKLKEVKE